MIRIDEIYQNLFLPKIKSKPQQSMHWFHPFGMTSEEALHTRPLLNERTKSYLFWDQEPFYPDVHKDTIDFFHMAFIQPYGENGMQAEKPVSELTIVTSEKNSKNLNELCEKMGYKQSYYFFHGWAALDWYRGYDRTSIIPKWKDREIKNTFFSPNRVVGGNRRHRISLLKNLALHNLVEGNQISFPKNCPYSNEDIYVEGVKLTLVFPGETAGQIPNESYKISLWEHAQNSLVNVVTETLYEESTLHLTEKTFKPIVMQMPFILVAHMYSLEYLRSYGFKTFGQFWDEDYDMQNNEDRMESITRILKDLNSLSIKEKKQLQKHLTPIVEHNFKWFYSRTYENKLWSELQGMMNQW